MTNEIGAVRANQRANQRARRAARVLLGGILIGAGSGHLSWARTAFRAQVPGWVPGDPDAIVLFSGAVEMALGTALVFRRDRWIGRLVAGFFIAVFPGNIAQLVGHKDAFGLNSDTQRAARLLFQPLLVAWALWSTTAAKSDQTSQRLSLQ